MWRGPGLAKFTGARVQDLTWLSQLHKFLFHLQNRVQGDISLAQSIECFDAFCQTLVQYSDNGTHELRNSLTKRIFGARSINLRVEGIWGVGIVLCAVLIACGSRLRIAQTFRCCWESGKFAV